MFDKLSIPVKGEPPKAAWGAGVANRLNELCAMAPAHTLVRDGQTGTGFAQLPANHRVKNGVSLPKPWTFSKHEDENGDEVGGWKNCKIQIGYSLAHMDETNKEKFSGFDQTEDGVYYIDVDLVNESVELKRVDFNDDESSSFEIPPSDLQNAHVNMEVGAVKDGVEAWSINWVPVIYKFI